MITIVASTVTFKPDRSYGIIPGIAAQSNVMTYFSCRVLGLHAAIPPLQSQPREGGGGVRANASDRDGPIGQCCPCQQSQRARGNQIYIPGIAARFRIPNPYFCR